MNGQSFTISITKKNLSYTIDIKIEIKDGNMQPLYDILKVIDDTLVQDTSNKQSVNSDKQNVVKSESIRNYECTCDTNIDIIDAARNGCLNHLMFFNKDSSTSNECRKRALFVACAKGRNHIIDYLIHNSEAVDINSQDGSGNTPLFYASVNKQKECVEFLLKNGADPTIKNYYGIPPINKDEIIVIHKK